AAIRRAQCFGLCSFRDSSAAASWQTLLLPVGLAAEQSKKTYSSVFLSDATTSGSPPVRSISLSDQIFSVLPSSFACTSSHLTPLWRDMFFSKRSFRVANNSTV